MDKTNWVNDAVNAVSGAKTEVELELIEKLYREELQFLVDSFAPRMEPVYNGEDVYEAHDAFRRVGFYLYCPTDDEGEDIKNVDYDSVEGITDIIESYLIEGRLEYKRTIARRILYLFNQLNDLNNLIESA